MNDAFLTRAANGPGRKMMANKVAVVTGGTRGIGGAIAIALKTAGYRVAANYGHDDASAA